MSIVRRDGKLFWHPYTLGVMPDHPTGYTGNALFRDRRWWVVAVTYRDEHGRSMQHHTPRSHWRVIALIRGLLGHREPWDRYFR